MISAQDIFADFIHSFIYSRSQCVIQGILKLVDFLLVLPYLAFVEDSEARDSTGVPWYLVADSCTGIEHF